MPSYQDIETRLKTVEDKVDFALSAIKVATPSPLAGVPPSILSLLDIYRESKRANLTIDVDPVVSESEHAADTTAG